MTNHTKMISRLEEEDNLFMADHQYSTSSPSLAYRKTPGPAAEMPRQPADMVKRMQEEEGEGASTAQAHIVDSSIPWWGAVSPAALPPLLLAI
jgi:hypothetical protein